MLDGKKLKELREGADLTQEALAERVGLSQNHISQIERGKKETSLKALKAIAQALGVPITELLVNP